MAAERASGCAADCLVHLMASKPRNSAEPQRDAPEKGETLTRRHEQPIPQLPHERDESADSHPGTDDERIAQAARDLAEGQQDTGRDPVVTKLAHKEFPQRTERQSTEKKTKA